MHRGLAAFPLTIILLAGAAFAAPGKEATETNGRQVVAGVEVIGDGHACTWTRSIDGWEAVDRDHVILIGPGKTRHLVRFGGACISNPKFEISIGVQSRDSRLCGYGGDSLLIDGERCSILEVWKMPPAEKRTAEKQD